MSRAVDVAAQAYKLAQAGNHRALRLLIADDATWEPSKKARWKPCRGGDEVVRTLVWRAGKANKMRPGETVDLGPHAVIRLRGRRLELIGACGLLSPKLFQAVEVKDGKIVRLRDFGKIEEALAATGHEG